MNEGEKLYGSTAAAHEIGCSGITLHNYERAGIISPRRTTTGRRIYTESDIRVARAAYRKNTRRQA